MRTLQTLLLPVYVAMPLYENALIPPNLVRALVLLFQRLDFQATLDMPDNPSW